MSFTEEFSGLMLKIMRRKITASMPLYDEFKPLIRKYPKQIIIFALIFYCGIGALVYRVYTTERTNQEKIRLQNMNYREQLTKLEQTETNLRSLILYIDEQKIKLRESQDLMQALKNEKDRLEPLVKADREIINTLFDVQEKKQIKFRWVNYLISFLLGVLSSLVAIFIQRVIIIARQKHKQ